MRQKKMVKPIIPVKKSIIFSFASALLGVLLSTSALASTSTPSFPHFVHTDGKKILDENNHPLYLYGINLGNWLLWEGYLMMGDYKYRTHTQFLNSLTTVFGSADKSAEFEHQWRLNYVNEQTLKELKQLGFNSASCAISLQYVLEK
ncbi:hypothetical protein [Psychromonas sp. MME2]|uniref:hypothetical protein n=1 Tax=Psychromonas sp. MME2 TaxID=3231033 RepID=UPI00339C28EE